MSGCRNKALLGALMVVGGILGLSGTAMADSTVCNFPRNAWQSAVASGDAGRIAAARQRAIAARHTCPTLYAQVMAWKAPARDRPRSEEPPPRRADPPPPPRREAPNPIGTHFRLVSRLAKDAPLPLLFDPGRGYLIGLEAGRPVKFALATGQKVVIAPASPPSAPLQQLGAYNAVTGTFYATGKAGELAYCNAVTMACAPAKNTTGLNVATLRTGTNPVYDALTTGTDTKGQAFVMTLRGGVPVARLPLAPFRYWAASADGRFFCSVATRPQPPYGIACLDLIKRKGTGQAGIGNFDPNPVADKTRWDETDAIRQSAFAASGNRVAVYVDGQVLVIDPAKPAKPLVYRLSEAGIDPAGRKFAIRFIDRDARIAVWDLREKFDTDGLVLAVINLEAKLPSERVRRFDLKFPARKSGIDEAPAAVNAFALPDERILFEAPFAGPLVLSLRDGKVTPLPTPEGERGEAYYASFVAPEEGLLFAKYSTIGNFDAFDVKGGIKGLGQPGSVNVWRLPGPGGYYFFHSQMDGPYEWQSEIRQYVPPPSASTLAPQR